MTSRERPIEIRVGAGQYRVGCKIGSGSFGVIYAGTHIDTSDKVAIKLEKADTRHPQLQYESRIYKHMKGSKGVPNVYFYGKEDEYFVLIMDMLGPSLEDLFNYCQRSFSLKTILMIADELLLRIETVHNFEFIHRDIKPDNFLVGVGQHLHSIYIIDFGLSKRFINPKTRRHIKFIEGKSLTGTARYASINTHLGYEQARRDDLETLGYVLIYFTRKGKLPWQGLKAKSKTQKYSRISAVKRETSVEQLCESSPVELGKYLKYTRKLEFSTKPDYSYLRALFKDLFDRHGYVKDGRYDWCIRASRLSRSNSISNRQSSTANANANATHGNGNHRHHNHNRQSRQNRQNRPSNTNHHTGNHNHNHNNANANDNANAANANAANNYNRHHVSNQHNTNPNHTHAHAHAQARGHGHGHTPQPQTQVQPQPHNRSHTHSSRRVHGNAQPRAGYEQAGHQHQQPQQAQPQPHHHQSQAQHQAQVQAQAQAEQQYHKRGEYRGRSPKKQSVQQQQQQLSSHNPNMIQQQQQQHQAQNQHHQHPHPQQQQQQQQARYIQQMQTGHSRSALVSQKAIVRTDDSRQISTSNINNVRPTSSKANNNKVSDQINSRNVNLNLNNLRNPKNTSDLSSTIASSDSIEDGNLQSSQTSSSLSSLDTDEDANANNAKNTGNGNNVFVTTKKVYPNAGGIVHNTTNPNNEQRKRKHKKTNKSKSKKKRDKEKERKKTKKSKSKKKKKKKKRKRKCSEDSVESD